MKKIAFIGQAMPRHKSHPHDWPSLNKWLFALGISEDEIAKYFLYSALVDYFPGALNGSHRIPSDEEIKKEQTRLKKDLLAFAPQIIIPVGKLSTSYCLNIKVKKLKGYVGKSFRANPYKLLSSKVLIIPFPHPSGASTWHRKKGNIELLKRALGLLKENLR